MLSRDPTVFGKRNNVNELIVDAISMILGSLVIWILCWLNQRGLGYVHPCQKMSLFCETRYMLRAAGIVIYPTLVILIMLGILEIVAVSSI